MKSLTKYKDAQDRHEIYDDALPANHEVLLLASTAHSERVPHIYMQLSTRRRQWAAQSRGTRKATSAGRHKSAQTGSKKQASVALSSCEAEIMALSEASKEAVYLTDFISELGFPASSTVSLATDNKGARDLAYNPEHHEKVKHIERRHFYIRELVEEQRLVVPYVNTVDNMADFFTKALPAASFYSFRNKIMNVPSSDALAARGKARALSRARKAALACAAEPPTP